MKKKKTKKKKGKKKKKEKKSECCTTKSKSQCSQGSFQNAWLNQFGWLLFDRESQICGVCVCVVLRKVGFQNLHPLEFVEEGENTL